MYVWALYVWALCVSTLCVWALSPYHTSQAERREHKEEVLGPSSWARWLTTPHLTITHKRTQRRSSWAEFLGRMAHHTTSHHHTSQAERREHKEEVLGPSSWAGWHSRHHHTSQAERREHKEEVLGPSSWAGWLTTPHLIITHKRTQRRSSWAEFLGRMAHHTTSHHHTSQAERREHKEEVLGPSSWAGCMCEHSMCEHYVWALYVCEHSHHITHHKPKEENTKKKFLGRVLGPDGILTTSHIITSHHIRHHKPKRQKSTSFLVKTSFKSIAEHRKVRELPRKMNIEEVEEPKKYENLQTKPVLDPFKSTADHLKVRELARKTNIEEVEEHKTRSRRPRPPGNYENSQTKRTCKHESTKIAMNSARHPSATSI